jgi:hypothetical protein
MGDRIFDFLPYIFIGIKECLMNMVKIIFIFLAILLMVFLIGCYSYKKNQRINGDGNIIIQEKQVDGFDRIFLTDLGNVNVYHAENIRVVVITDSNIQDFVLLETDNNVLTLSLKSGLIYNNITQLTFNVYLPELKSVNTEGVGNITIAAGNATNLEISISGVGIVDSQNYEVQNITITHSGVGNAKIWATNSLNGEHSGIGNILYKGNPTINITRTGLGKIKQL